MGEVGALAPGEVVRPIDRPYPSPDLLRKSDLSPLGRGEAGSITISRYAQRGAKIGDGAGHDIAVIVAPDRLLQSDPSHSAHHKQKGRQINLPPLRSPSE
jgi:hypothetical protein